MWAYVGGVAALAVVAAAITYFRGDNNSGPKERDKPPSSPTPDQPVEPYRAKRRPPVFSAPSEHHSNKKANAGSIDNKTPFIQTTKRHLWLLDLAVGEVITNEKLVTELEIEPSLGWHQDRSIILAILVEPDSFYAHKRGPRLRISSIDYTAAALPPISRQAVPILSSHDNGWRFEGFFRLGHPTKTSVACNQIAGAPPELLDLKKAQN
ncbi:hypothetical protein FE249_20720 (plasmid) [Acidiphilium multivorum]|uniref:hypothetical protein n=1 Tax=Acidiphilium multivorum TaxID=62140 RepID=UPI001F4C0D7E|nr:hypothetical protein [Acidiphilium multivorum]UNC16591.1 hypothetical protein FE249_20720 [Acidiphilium multivorum]